MLTSSDTGFDLRSILADITVVNVPSEQTTTFKNVYTSEGRLQTLRFVAENLSSEYILESWRRAPIVHLGPIAREVDPNIARLFSNSMVCMTPQGWYRQWDGEGRVSAADWPDADEIFPFASVVVISMEDIPDSETLTQICRLSPLVVLTRQSSGCTVYLRNEIRDFPAPSVKEVNPTGAGDIFATAFFIRLYQTKGNAWEAAEYANRIAALSVELESLEAKIVAIKDLVRREG